MNRETDTRLEMAEIASLVEALAQRIERAVEALAHDPAETVQDVRGTLEVLAADELRPAAQRLLRLADNRE